MNSANAPRHPERQREDGHFGVVRHQLRRESCFGPLQPVVRRFFLLRHALGRILLQMWKRHQHRLGIGIKGNGQSAKGAARKRNCQREIKCTNVPAKRLRQSLEKPFQREKPPLLFARFVDFAVCPGDQIFQIAPGFRF